MVMSYFDSSDDREEYINSFYRTHEFDEEHILVTTETGSWAVLDSEEYDLLRQGKAEEKPELYEKLKELGVILTEDNVEKISRMYAKRKGQLFHPPSLHIITPTMRCNAQCLYCHSRAIPSAEGEYNMDRETAKETVDFILSTPMDSLVIEFQGGDCLLNFETTEFIIDYARKRAEQLDKDVDFRLVTNMTMMNEEILESLKERNIRGISTSLDGPKEVHNKNRPYVGGGGTYEDAIHWIDRINEEFSEDFSINALSTITRYNFGHGEELVEEYMDHGMHGVWLRPLNNIGFAEEKWEEIGYTMDEFFDFWKDTLDYILDKNREEDVVFKELMTMIFLRKILTQKDPQMVDIMSPCGAGIGQLLYKHNGDIHTCDEGKIYDEFRLGNVKEDSFQEVMDSDSIRTMVDVSSKESYICDNCEWKPYCGVCPIYTYAQQGSVVSKVTMDDRANLYRKVIKEIFRRIIYSEEDRKVFRKWLEDERRVV